jgi:acyl-CoA dehydrogenase-like protein
MSLLRQDSAHHADRAPGIVPDTNDPTAGQVAISFVDNDVLPVINDYWERAEFPWPLIKKMGTLGVVGDGIKGYGYPAMATAPEAATPEVDPQQVIDQVFDFAEKMLAVQREFAKSLATAGSATDAARQHPNPLWALSATGRGRRRQCREQPRPTNNLRARTKGQT